MILAPGKDKKMQNNGLRESILSSIKKQLGVHEEYKHFDDDLIFHINSVFSILTQLGVGPEKGFSISGAEDVWEDFIDEERLEMMKSYIALKVRLIFDPPANSVVKESIQSAINEFEWRLNVAVDPEE